MNARTADVPDTARHHLLTLARRPDATQDPATADEVAAASVISDQATRDRTFAALCRALASRDIPAARTALDTLTGGNR